MSLSGPVLDSRTRQEMICAVQFILVFRRNFGSSSIGASVVWGKDFVKYSNLWQVIQAPGAAMKTIADLVNDLFRTHRHLQTQREYTNTEVSRALGGQIDQSYLAKLR